MQPSARRVLFSNDNLHRPGAACRHSSKVLGFAVGFGASFAAFAAICIPLGIRPIGPGWLFLFGGIGIATARFFAEPAAKTEGLRSTWWSLDKGLRLSVVLAVTWLVGAILFQLDRFSIDFMLVFVPPMLLIGG